jgi:predicted DNA-binding protein (MmcQ/YjbR family)
MSEPSCGLTEAPVLISAQTLHQRFSALPGAALDHPFGPDVEVYKVAGKVFGWFVMDGAAPRVTLKCDPVLAEVLRGEHAAIRPGYHTDKRNWNTLYLDEGALEDELVWGLIEASYDLVRGKLPKKVQAQLER